LPRVVGSRAPVKSRFAHALFHRRIRFYVEGFAIEAERYREAWFLKNEFRRNPASDGAAIRIFSHREIRSEPSVARKDIALPAAPDDRVALTHHETIAGVGESARIVAALRA